MKSKRWTVDGAWCPRRLDVLQSPAWRNAPRALKALLEILEIEHMRRKGGANGELFKSYPQFVKEGLNRSTVSTMTKLGEALGLMKVNRETGVGKPDLHDACAYTLKHIKAPIDEAVSDLMVKRREAGEAFDKLYSVYSKEERRSMTTLQDVPELNGQYSKWDLISIALNTGNEGNFQRLTDDRVKGHFTPQQVDVALHRLDARDWKFVQSAWNMIDGYWPQIEAREKRVTGVAPEKIAPREITNAHGTFKGGYFPLKYDNEISSLARDDDLKEIAASMTGGRYGKAQTKNGHTKERSQSSGRPVMIDIAGGCEAITWFDKGGGRVIRGLFERRKQEKAFCLIGL